MLVVNHSATISHQYGISVIHCQVIHCRALTSSKSVILSDNQPAQIRLIEGHLCQKPIRRLLDVVMERQYQPSMNINQPSPPTKRSARVDSFAMFAPVLSIGKRSLYLSYINTIHLLLAAARQQICQSLPLTHHIRELTVRQVVIMDRFVKTSLHQYLYNGCKVLWNTDNGTASVESLIFDTTVVHRHDRYCPELPISVFDGLNQQISLCDSSRIKITWND